MLRSVNASLIATLLAGSHAFAADLPRRVAPQVFVPPPPAFSWTGAYIGANVGDAFDNRAGETTTGSPTTGLLAIVPSSLLAVGAVPAQHTLTQGGVTAGGQIGYNYQLSASPLGGIVVGIEADANYVGGQRNDFVPTTFGLTNTYHDSVGFLGTVRGRLGVAIDRLLVYGTGGLAYGHDGYSHTVFTNAPPISPVYAGGTSGTKAGYAVGGGVEYALPSVSFLSLLHSGAVTIRAEFLHYDLGSHAVTLNPVAPFGFPGTSFTDQVRSSGNLVRAAINYKLDFATPAAVVARY